MGEILGIGCSHAPMILNPPEEWGRMRERIFSHVPGYQAPAQLLAELGEDQGLSEDRRNQARIADAFRVLHDRLHAWAPDVLDETRGELGATGHAVKVGRPSTIVFR